MTVTGATFKQIVLDVEKTVLLFVYCAVVVLALQGSGPGI
jgi:hypothetical protein